MADIQQPTENHSIYIAQHNKPACALVAACTLPGERALARAVGEAALAVQRVAAVGVRAVAVRTDVRRVAAIAQQAGEAIDAVAARVRARAVHMRAVARCVRAEVLALLADPMRRTGVAARAGKVAEAMAHAVRDRIVRIRRRRRLWRRRRRNGRRQCRRRRSAAVVRERR